MVKKKRRVMKKSTSQVKKDLEIFEKGVIRLRELEGELGALDTRGFYREEQNIRAKLKNVSDIPLIERDIKNLRLKINKKYKPRRAGGGSYKKIEKGLAGVKSELPGIKRGIALLAKNLAEVPKKKVRKIDLGVGSLVDSDFNVFLDDIKSTLSERIRGREKEIKDILNADLKKREAKFSRRHRTLVAEFSGKEQELREQFRKRYNEKVESSLKKEVKQRFDRELNEKLKKEKSSLAKKYQSHLNARVSEHLKKDRKRIQKKLSGELKKKITTLHKDFDRRRVAIGKELRDSYADRLRSIEKRRKELDTRKKKIDEERRESMERISRLSSVTKKCSKSR
jgi:hypothetical protein